MLNHRLAVLEDDGNNVETSVGIQPVFENIGVGDIDKPCLSNSLCFAMRRDLKI